MLRTLQKAIEQKTKVGNYESYMYHDYNGTTYQVVTYHGTIICKFSNKYYLVDN